MLRKTMVALFAVASIGMLAPDLAFGARGPWRRWWGGGGGRGGSFGGGFAGARSGGFGGSSFGGARFGGSAFQGGAVRGSFARTTAIGLREFKAAALRATALRPPVFATTDSAMGEDSSSADSLDPATTTDYYDYPYYVADDSYYDDGGATSCDAACIPGTAGVSSRFKSADDAAVLGLWSLGLWSA